MNNEVDIIKNKVIKILKSNIDTLSQLGELPLDSKLKDLDVNSIDFIKCVVAIEAEFGFEFEYDYINVKKFDDIGSLVQYIEERIEHVNDN